MAKLRDRPLLTIEYDSPALFRPPANSCYIYGARPEERTLHMEGWRHDAPGVKILHLEENGREGVNLTGEVVRTLSLRKRDEIAHIFESLACSHVSLDITGLSNHVWPAILKVALELSLYVDVVYVEPKDYTYSASPRENVIFDLSERILGISPIPQFTSLSEPLESEIALIPLLGFEGARLAYLIEEIQPPGDNIDPVVGVPGFRAEYPFFTYQGNQIPLKASRSYRNIRFAKANCPFSLYYTLVDITSRYDAGQFFKIGLIGTKPHALGAILFALVSPSRVELVYDHTKRRPQRSTGHSHCLIYPVSEFLGYALGAP